MIKYVQIIEEYSFGCQANFKYDTRKVTAIQATIWNINP